jgi:uncharacterized protein (TIRG00374 family)
MIDQKHKSLFSARQRKTLIFSLVLTAGAYLSVVILTGYDDIQIAFTQIGFLGWGLLLSCSFASYLIRFIRWQGYIKASGTTVPVVRHFLYYLAGFALTTTPGKAGETIRSILLRPHGVSYPSSLASFFTERFLDVIVIALLASLSVFIFDNYTEFVLLSAAIILAVIPFLRSQLLTSLILMIHNKLNWEKVKTASSHLLSLIQAAQLFLTWPRIFTGLSLGFLAWIIQGLAFYFVVSTLNVELGLLAAMGIYSISLLAGAVSFIPGGVGSTEVVMGLLLSALGADTSVAVSAPLISRLSTLWFAVALGLLSSTWLSSQHK